LKNFTYLLLAGLFILIQADVNAQSERFLHPNGVKPVNISQPNRISPENRCGTMQSLEEYFRANPDARAMAERNKTLFAPENPSNGQNQRVQTIITVPVVFHIVGNATRQSQVTDADILWQLNKLNEDYGGSNADSTNAAYGFYPVRAYNGYCQIRYCMAQRNALDLPSNGIERVVSTLNGTQNCGNNSLVKHTSSGGADSWDPSRFLNIWVGEFGPCLLGVATFPGTGPANEQGLIVSYEGFSNNPAYVDPAFALGRTAAHELGHYWGLYHIWGDEGGCSTSDFRQLPGTCLLPASLAGASNDVAFGDTPNQAAQTTNCPSGMTTDACATVAPGKQYQNYMDYTEDACYSMFTKMQADRMQWVLDNCRASLKTSNGCTPPPPAAGNDARISLIINPVNGTNIGCTTVTPVVTIQNLGTNTLTSAKINLMLNGTPNPAGYPVSWTGSLTQGQSANVTLPVVNLAAIQTHVLKIYTTLPNGLTDANSANDTATTSVVRIAPSALPVVNGFESSLTPPGWSNLNPNNDGLSWFRFNPSNGGAGGSVWAAVADNYDFNVQNTVDDIVSPVINTTGLLANDSLLIQFDLAHKNYVPGPFDPPIQGDSLKIMVTNNCGATWTTIWAKGDPDLATAGSSQAIYDNPAQGDWRTIKPAIGNNLFGAGQIQVAFRNVNGFGNVVWLDNINIVMKPRKDMQTTAIVRPNNTECAPPFAPSITVRNGGGEAVSAFKTGYILNGGAPFIQVNNIALAPGASTTVTFPAITPPVGNNTIKLFVADPITPSTGPDGTPSNDTLTRTFFVASSTVPNVVEGFEGATFPPSGWFRINPDNAITWQRTTPGKTSSFSAFVNNYDYATNVYLFDYLQAPPVNTTGADSLIITFDVANQYWTDGVDTSVDNLSVLIARNCSATFSTVYSETGTALATAGGGPDPYLAPAESDWKKKRVVVNLVTTPANSVVVQFRNGDAYGNNTYIDNINITPQFKRDIEVVSVSPDVICTPAITPVATIRNRGTETVTGYKISYAVGTSAPTQITVTGVTIAPGATATVTLPAGTLASGANTIKVFTQEPTTASGTGDQYLVNDTLSKTSYATLTQVAAPLVETFEGTFLPTGWAVANPDNSITWQKTSSAGRNSTSSAFMRNFIYLTAFGQKDILYTPPVTYSDADSVLLSFDLSAATKASPSAAVPMDTLEVLVTRDCGNTFTSVYKKWGAQLQTVLDPVSPLPSEYVPFADYLWRTETINLTSFRPNGPLQVLFKNSSNGGNNIYIDNVNLRTRILPAGLRSNGFVISPSPFSNQFNIWWIQAPTDLRFVAVFNSAGQQVWKKEYNGSTSNVINVNMTMMAAGIYIVHLGYSDQGKDQEVRILKAQ
jgi:hypothetical protein